MAAFVLFMLAVAGGVVAADLVWENPAAGQVTMFHQTIGGYREGWLLAIAAGLGLVAACSWSPPSTRRRDDVRVASSAEICGRAWRTRWRCPCSIVRPD